MYGSLKPIYVPFGEQNTICGTIYQQRIPCCDFGWLISPCFFEQTDILSRCLLGMMPGIEETHGALTINLCYVTSC